jgi:hypothetical protein
MLDSRCPIKLGINFIGMTISKETSDAEHRGILLNEKFILIQISQFIFV